MRPTRIAAMGIGLAAGLVTTLGFVGGDGDAGDAEGVVVALRCLGVDADGTVALASSTVADELVRDRLVDLASIGAAEAGEVVDRDRLEADLAELRFDLDRCNDDELLSELVADPDRWPCDLDGGATDALDEVVILLELDCELGAADE